jgi:hypothetical protein
MQRVRHLVAVTRQVHYLGQRPHGIYDARANCSTGPQELTGEVPEPLPVSAGSEPLWDSFVDPETGRTLYRQR